MFSGDTETVHWEQMGEGAVGHRAFLQINFALLETQESFFRKIC